MKAENELSIDTFSSHHDNPDSELTLSEASHTLPGVSEELSGGAGAMYLREIKHDLLTAQEEVSLARQLESGRAALKELATANGSLNPDQRAELENLAEDGKRARERLIECNLRLVVSVARKYLGRGVSFLDLVQEGNIGLQTGVDKYDWKKGFRFSTYVYWWIRQAAQRATVDQSRIIRLPVHANEFLTKVAKTERELSFELGREPTVDEVAQYLDIDPERINEIRLAARTPLSLEIPIDPDDQTSPTLAENIPGEINGQNPQQRVEDSDLAERIQAGLDKLYPREEKVLKLRFGFGTGYQATLGEIGIKLGVSKERVRQIEAEALDKLRRMPKLRRELIDYVD